MDTLRALADVSIRRAIGFVGLGIGTTLLALSYQAGLALRIGGDLLALLCLGLLGAAWRAPRRDLRHSELWALLAGTTAEPLRRLPRAQAQALLAAVLRERLVWHAVRVGCAALAFWGLAALLLLARALA